MIVCFEGSRHIMWRLFVCLERKNEAKKIKYMLSIRWAMPWPMVARQEVPNGISSTEGKNINHLRRDNPSKNN